MADMKFKFTIQPYQTEAVDSVVGVFAGQPFNDRFTYRRDVEIKGTVKHIYFIAETKGTMETLNLKPIEKAKIDCARKLFHNLSSADVVYDSVDSYQHLLDIMDKL